MYAALETMRIDYYGVKEISTKFKINKHTVRTRKKEFTNKELPILSIDTKKKEMLGNFYREGKLFTRKIIEVNDHDFNSFAKVVIIPYGIYDFNIFAKIK